MMLESSKEKRRFSRENYCSKTILWRSWFFIAPMTLIYRIPSRKNVIGSWCEKGPF
jgi:hypothetical protein